ncbi:hypothetical protein BD410DRAFT_808262 [Rickenella mellea]|uniref:Uncharacterized protein n=1 Tax=Rickenella mellea TaxID=50990 RepID=A0A4Y7PP08_9AGAM|nr:hypothetical protein BD410DRAFT_808262 [Rickenella mellea]
MNFPDAYGMNRLVFHRSLSVPSAPFDANERCGLRDARAGTWERLDTRLVAYERSLGEIEGHCTIEKTNGNSRRWDSYPAGLGCTLVTAIPVNAGELEEWLKNKREFFDAEELRAFIINKLVAFRFANIPRGEDGNAWMQYLDFDCDGFGYDHVEPSTPHQYALILSRTPPEPSPSGLDRYGELEIKALAQSEWTSQDLNLSQQFSLHAAEGLIMLHYHSFSTLAMNTPESLTFQTFALGLLSTTAEGLIWISPNPYIERKIDNLLPTFTSWVESKDWERPGACFHWFRDVLIWFASDLDHEPNRKAAVGLVVAMIQEHNLDYCIALVFSVRHLIVVKFSNGEVDTPNWPRLRAFAGRKFVLMKLNKLRQGKGVAAGGSATHMLFKGAEI